jgi:hypothetical protein
MVLLADRCPAGAHLTLSLDGNAEVDMTTHDDTRSTASRRALLGAALGSAAAVAVTAIAPPGVTAHDPEDVQKGVDNPTTAPTSITNSGGTSESPALALAGVSTGNGTGVHGFSGDSGSTLDAPLPITGVFGSTVGADGVGVTGFGEDTEAFTTVGVFGSADNGVIGQGVWGVVGVGHTGLQGLTMADDPGAVGVWAEAAETNQYAFRAIGKVKFSRSGRLLLGSGKSSAKVTLAGVTSGTHVLAQLGSYRPGVQIAAVVPTTGSFTVYLSKALTSNAYVHWVVLDV